jgi:hypothetical protein
MACFEDDDDPKMSEILRIIEILRMSEALKRHEDLSDQLI